MLWETRPCCREAGDKAPVFYNPVGAESELTNAPVIDVEPMKSRRDQPTCFHEAGHTIVRIALGFRAGNTTVDGQPVSCSDGSGRVMSYPQHIALDLAGSIAELWSTRFVYRFTDDDLAPYLERVRRMLSAGSCDLCSAVRSATVLSRHAPDADVIAILRDIEAQAIALVQTRSVWLAIRALADALAKHGTVTGTEAEAIARKFFEPGDFEIATPILPKEPDHEPAAVAEA